MFLNCLSLVVAVALGQQAAEDAAWLKAIPSDVDVVARVRPLEKSRDDLVAMTKAMSATLSPMAEPMINMGLERFSAMFGKDAVSNPFVVMMKLPKPGETMPAWGVLIKSDNYASVLKNISQKDDAKPKSLGGYDSFETSQGQTYFSLKGAGFVGFGPDEALIKALVKPTATLDSRLSDEVKAEIFAGDMGLYLNVAAVQKQYGEQIDAAKAQIIAGMDQAGGQINSQMMDAIKSFYGTIFDGIKTGDALAIHLDFSAANLTVGGLVNSKAEPTKTGTSAPKLGAGDMLGKLPNDAMSYVYLSMNPSSAGSLQKIGMSFMTGGSKPSPELDAAITQQTKLAGDEAYTATTTGSAGTKTINVTSPIDPKKSVEIGTAVFKAMASPDGFIKDIIVDPNAETYQGFVLNRVKMTYNLEKMVTPNLPGGVETMKKLLGGETGYAWYGTNGKLVLSVSAKTWDEAKAQIDAVIEGKNSLAALPSYVALREQMPKKATVLVMMSAQGLVRQMASQFGVLAGKELVIPPDMPKETALLGLSVVTTPKGFSFKFVLPSNTGPVFEKGLMPLMMNMGVQQ